MLMVKLEDRPSTSNEVQLGNLQDRVLECIDETKLSQSSRLAQS